MANSPTPSLESIRGTNSIESFGENNGYLSDSPFTLSGTSPPVSDSVICEEFINTNTSALLLENHNLPISTSVSSSSSSSGLSGCGSSGSSNNVEVATGINRKDRSVGKEFNALNTSNDNDVAVPRCTACKSKCSEAVAKCFECVNFLCSNCVTAHEFMHCFNGHNVCLINGFGYSMANHSMNSNSIPNFTDYKLSSSVSIMLQQDQDVRKHATSKLSKIVMNTTSTIENNKDEFCSKLAANNLVSDFLPSLANNCNNDGSNNLSTSHQFCSKHKSEIVKFFCRTCCVLICKECISLEHSPGLHEIALAHQLASSHTSENIIKSIVCEFRAKIGEFASVISSCDTNVNQTKLKYQKAYNEINETYQFFCSILDERKQEMIKELEAIYSAKISSNTLRINRAKDFVEKVLQSCDSIERIPKIHNFSDILKLRKALELQHQSALQELRLPFELEFISNYQSIQASVHNTFGYIRATSEGFQKQPPITRPSHGISASIKTALNNNDNENLKVANLVDSQFLSTADNTFACYNGHHLGFENSFGTKRFHSTTLNSGATSGSNLFSGTFQTNIGQQLNPYEKWSNGGSDNCVADQFPTPLLNSSSNYNNVAVSDPSLANAVITNTGLNCLSASGGNCSDSLIDLTSKLLSATIYPPKSQIKRQKMIYHCKFGEFGVMEGQFTEPSGVAVNAQNDIIVADTNNHRIQIFDKEGRFKFQFGECGKRDSQLLYPNRVAVVKTSGDIIVTERSPTHQIQIYNQYGQFVRKFGANILQHPRGVTVDNKGRIIVVECKVMRVIIFDQNGNVIQKFGCSKHLEFPNGVVVNNKQEIFISDNRAHCVKVFNYEGQYLRQIGGEGVTNYPIGVGINCNGEILIADNHNNFNLTIFTQDGQMVAALESKVKHAQCFDVALMDDSSVVLASKDYRLYIYRYVQVPPPINL